MANLRDITGNWFSDPNLAIADRQLKGASHVNKFGHNTCIAACAIEDIWDNGSTYVYPTAARIHNIASTSTCDTSCGTGARSVTIFGLDGCYREINETVNLAGTCNVATSNSYLRVFRMFVATGGSTGEAQGNISATAQVDSSVSAIILAGADNQTHMAIYTVPAGKTGYVTQIYGSIGRKQTASYSLDFVVRPQGGVFNTKFTIDGNSAGSSGISHRPTPYIVIPGKSDIKIKASASAAGADVTAGFDLILL